MRKMLSKMEIKIMIKMMMMMMTMMMMSRMMMTNMKIPFTMSTKLTYHEVRCQFVHQVRLFWIVVSVWRVVRAEKYLKRITRHVIHIYHKKLT